MKTLVAVGIETIFDTLDVLVITSPPTVSVKMERVTSVFAVQSVVVITMVFEVMVTFPEDNVVTDDIIASLDDAVANSEEVAIKGISETEETVPEVRLEVEISENTDCVLDSVSAVVVTSDKTLVLVTSVGSNSLLE